MNANLYQKISKVINLTKKLKEDVVFIPRMVILYIYRNCLSSNNRVSYTYSVYVVTYKKKNKRILLDDIHTHTYIHIRRNKTSSFF